MRYITILLALFLTSGTLISAQQRECGMEDYMAEKLKDPAFARQWEINQAKFREAVQRSLDME